MDSKTKLGASAATIIGLIGGISLMVSQMNRGDTQKLAWDQPGESLEQVQSYVYKYYVDDDIVGKQLNTVTCVSENVPNTFVCSTPLAGLDIKPGSHTLGLVTVNPDTGEESAKNSFTFNMVISTVTEEKSK